MAKNNMQECRAPRGNREGLMLVDGRKLGDGEVLETDVCVVGSGPAGLTVASSLGRRGLRVVVLEGGPLDPNGNGRPDTVESVGIPYRIAQSRSFGFGGTSNAWPTSPSTPTGIIRLRALDDADFENRPWVPDSGWPFGSEELRDHYRRARQLMGLAFGAEDESRLGDRFGSSALNATGGPLETQYYYCLSGATYGEGARVEFERFENVVIYTGATAVEVRCRDGEDVVSSVRVANEGGRHFEVRARTFVLAGGAVETPRLLLASTGRQPAGLGNGHDLVGRYFMEHPHYVSGLFIPRDPSLLGRLDAFAVHNNQGLLVQRKYSLNDRINREERLLRIGFRLVPTPWTEAVQSLRYDESALTSIRAIKEVRRAIARRESPTGATLTKIVRGLPHIGRHAVKRGRAGIGSRMRLAAYTKPQLFIIQASAEQAPNPASRIRLVERRDRFGVPTAVLDWRLTEQDRESIRRVQELVGNAWSGSGYGSVESVVHSRDLPPALSGGHHHMGTLRMHDEPRRGVVDRDCRVHGIHNLYVAGSAVFPTSGYANPTLTILALAFRLADRIADTMALKPSLTEPSRQRSPA